MSRFITTTRTNKDGTVEEIVEERELQGLPSPLPDEMDPIRAQLAGDPELHGLSLYEKKAVLINRELDSHGMSRYQWWIWCLCGFGYFLDLMWAQAFGIAVPAIQPEFGLTDPQTAKLSIAFNAGLTAGAFTWGFLVDIVGRWWAFNGTCFIASLFGLFLGVSPNYTTLLVLVAFCGFGVGGNIPVDTMICLEFIPQNRRFLLVVLSLFQPLGVVVSSAIAYGLVPNHSCAVQVPCGTVVPCCDKASNYGWRYYFFCLGAITLFIFLVRFLAFNFRESPKYLTYRGHDDEAAKVLDQIARFNHRQPMITLEHFEALSDSESINSDATDRSNKRLVLQGDETTISSDWRKVLRHELIRLSQLFKTWGITVMTLLTWFTYMFDYLSFSAAGFFIPTILKAKGAQLDISVNQTYRNYIIIYTPGIGGALLGGLLYTVPGIGRKWGMVISSALQGVSLFLFAAAKSEAAYVGFNVLEYFMQTLFNAILYGWTPEVFPAPVRGTACGLASFFGRIFGIVAPLIGGQILSTYHEDRSRPDYGNRVLYFAGASVFVASLCVMLMPGKRIGAQSL